MVTSWLGQNGSDSIRESVFRFEKEASNIYPRLNEGFAMIKRLMWSAAVLMSVSACGGLPITNENKFDLDCRLSTDQISRSTRTDFSKLDEGTPTNWRFSVDLEKMKYSGGDIVDLSASSMRLYYGPNSHMNYTINRLTGELSNRTEENYSSLNIVTLTTGRCERAPFTNINMGSKF